eukprot:2225437-Rhodomonas_salina.2
MPTTRVPRRRPFFSVCAGSDRALWPRAGGGQEGFLGRTGSQEIIGRAISSAAMCEQQQHNRFREAHSVAKERCRAGAECGTDVVDARRSSEGGNRSSSHGSQADVIEWDGQVHSRLRSRCALPGPDAVCAGRAVVQSRAELGPTGRVIIGRRSARGTTRVWWSCAMPWTVTDGGCAGASNSPTTRRECRTWQCPRRSARSGRAARAATPRRTAPRACRRRSGAASYP